ncbi:MAG: precorrin-6y C5,15-methyltransferase (decarboxylating) subunit CbiE, partial [Acidimicrobiales bacterium]
MPDRPATVTVIGIAGHGLGQPGPDVVAALDRAGLVVGGRRHLDAFEEWQRPRGGPPVRSAVIGGDADDACRRAAAASGEGIPVCVLASGDPGFFGIVRALLRVIDRRDLVVVPAPSSVSLAFARIGLPWDDATVVSAHGRPLADAIGAIRVARKVAVLTSPESPPEAVGTALVAARAAVDVVAVCSRLGQIDESVTMVGLDGLASGAWDPLSVLILLGPAGRRIAGWGGAADDAKPLAWGLPDDTYVHREGMITKSEVRAVAVGKLALPPAGVLWDIGAGSGSVAVECASLSPG